MLQAAAAEAAAVERERRKQLLQKKKGKTKSEKEKAAADKAAAEAAEAERLKAEQEARRQQEEVEKRRRQEQLELIRKQVSKQCCHGLLRLGASSRVDPGALWVLQIMQCCSLHMQHLSACVARSWWPHRSDVALGCSVCHPALLV